ncbi:hypothetical protein GGX14DRAFT_428345 [Mycena pura]|uniref:Uncharacterized protein n=1 Tax=Mycena pura TaxID=153505 RepID=A0AAD6VVH5_9AGAR|nr:hypothetical protein GGX14DRAFT_428345 [Mycena pura]
MSNSIPCTRPLQDITARFVSPNPPTPAARPRRKPKTPGGALGAKLRLRIAATTTTSRANATIFPSSLPPSSPPFASSSMRGPPVFNSEDEVAREMYAGDDDVRSDFGSQLPSDVDAENRAPARLSDPFGFFAVEVKLKAARAAHPPPPPVAPPFASRGTVMPATPHKRKPGVSSHGVDHFSPATASLPSSPSPVKGAGVPVPDNASEMAQDPMRRELFPARDDRNDDLPPSKRPRTSLDASEPPTPPRRSTRTRSKLDVPKALKQGVKPRTKGKTMNSDTDDEGDMKPPNKKLHETSLPQRKSARARQEPVKFQKRARKAPERTKAKNTIEDDDDDGRVAAERQARIEYFKKLQDYSFEKENVYVI